MTAPAPLRAPPGRSAIRILDSCPSTNDEAMAWGRRGAADGACVAADEQTAGRGRRGRGWHSPPGRNLYASLVVRCAPQSAGLLALLGALVVRDAAAALLAADERARIKWPNDVLIDGRKVAGVLAEWVAGPPAFGVVGVGLNVNGAAGDLPAGLRRPATTLQQALARPVERSALLADLLQHFDRWRGRLDSAPATIVAALKRHCSTLGRRVRVLPPGAAAYTGLARDLDAAGHLVVRTEQGRDRRVLAGDVDLLPAGPD
jgi:BirA family biotin operon repressor/biotin-[acetyl-CoA-carboxylase] ligase